MEWYLVQSGDTVTAIARKYGVSVQSIVWNNGLSKPRNLVPGQVLLIPLPAETYRIRQGDTLFSIATRFATTVRALLRNNTWLTLQPRLLPGETITIRYRQQPSDFARINGYAYPGIATALLNRTLPFLSTFTIFGYGFTTDGTLIPPEDAPLLQAVRAADVTPILLLSSITANGNFDSALSSQLFHNTGLQTTVLTALVQVMREKGYGGLDIDFEFVLPEDAQAFLTFVRHAAQVMHENGFFVNVDLAPKTSVDQRGLLYEAHDYAALADAADTVLLMTYEWGYTYGPPMAIAPIEPVKRVVSFARSQIPDEKIMLGMSNYGYDWTLPFQKGITRAQTISNQYALQIAFQNGATIQYDKTAQAPWFSYRKNGLDYVVWFEDARSIKARIDLMLADNLRGLGYWNLMRPFAQNWTLLSVMLTPEAVSEQTRTI